MAHLRHTRKLQEVELKDTRNDWYIVLLEQFVRESLAGVDLSPEGMGLRQRNVNKPDATASFVTLQVWIVVVEECEDGCDEHRDTLLV
jgi:hypothetical protein